MATVSVGSVTLAALIPLIGDSMLRSGREDPFHSAFAWSTVGLAILLGGLIYIMLPVATSWFDERDKRVLRRRIRDRQKELEDTWGSDVKT